MRWWFKISCCQRLERVAERTDLFDLVALAAGDGLVEKRARPRRPLGEVDVTHRLFGQPGPEQLVVGIAATQPEQHAIVAAFIEALGAGQQELADPVERIDFPAPVSERLVLDPSAHLVDAAVGDAHDMERIRDADGMVEVSSDASPVALGEVGGDHLDGLEPQRVLGGAPSPQVGGCVALHHVDHLGWSRSTSPVA